MSQTSAELRSDAKRNRDAIVDSATCLLAERPDASMLEIADASRVGRTTLYRHFPSRDALVRALVDRVFDEAHQLIAGVVAEHGTTAGALPPLAAGLVGLGARYRFLEVHAAHRDQAMEDQDATGSDPLLAYLEAARRRGELRRDLSARWMLAIFRGAAVAAVHEVNAGYVEAELAGRQHGETLLAAFATQRS